MRKGRQISKILTAGILIALGLIFLKFLPMKLFGSDILFDASFHIAAVCFVIYILWFFVDQNHKLHIPFYIFSALILFIISVQRIVADAHNDVGLLLGLLLSLVAIGITERKNLKGKLRF